MQTLSLALALNSYGFDVTVISYFEFDDYIVGKFLSTCSHIELLNLDRRIAPMKLVGILIKKIRSINADIVHIQYMAPGALPIIAARLAGVKHIFATVHQPYTKSHGWLAKVILRMASLLTSKFIAVSQNAEYSWFGASYLFNEIITLQKPPRHFTIYNSVDTKLIERTIEAVNVKDLRKGLAISEGTQVIGAISRLQNEKGIDILVEAFNLLVREGSEAHLLVVGSGPDEKMLKKSVHGYGLDDRVTFYGEAKWPTAMELMILMDVVVVPSRFEGFGLTAAEAMAAGKPVVASDTTGLKEVIVDGETGVLFPVGDSLSLMQSLKLLVNNPELCNHLGYAGRKRVREHFSSEVFTSNILALYSNYLQKVL